MSFQRTERGEILTWISRFLAALLKNMKNLVGATASEARQFFASLEIVSVASLLRNDISSETQRCTC